MCREELGQNGYMCREELGQNGYIHREELGQNEYSIDIKSRMHYTQVIIIKLIIQMSHKSHSGLFLEDCSNVCKV